MQSLAVKTVGARLSVVKQSFFGLPGQYGRRVTKANSKNVALDVIAERIADVFITLLGLL